MQPPDQHCIVGCWESFIVQIEGATEVFLQAEIEKLSREARHEY